LPHSCSDPLRIGVVCSSEVLEDWQARSLRHLLLVEHAEVSLIVLSPTILCSGAGVPRRGSAWLLFENRWVRRRSRALQRAGQSLLSEEIRVCQAGSDAATYSQAMARIRAQKLDVIVHLDPWSTPVFELDSAARLGLVHFSIGGMDAPASPPCFWPMYGGRELTVVTMWHRSSNMARALRRGTLRTLSYSYVRNLDSALYSLVDWPAQAVRTLRGDIEIAADAETYPDSELAGSLPSMLQMVRFFLLTIWHGAKLVAELLTLEEIWSIGISRHAIRKVLSDPDALIADVEWLPELAKGDFLADPFALRRGEQLSILAERFDWRAGTGSLVALQMQDSGAMVVSETDISTASAHMAYPYLVEHKGQIYCIPDTAEELKVSLYRAVEFPYQWERVKTLVSGIAARDATVFRHGGRWWLFCSARDPGSPTYLRARESGAFNTLYIWHANDLLGPWKSHVGNAVKTDVRSSRPAGTPFRHKGDLFRPAQDCSGTYGGAVSINRVTRLSPTEFAEQQVCVLRPRGDSRYPQGLHTLSRAGNWTFIDGKRSVVSWRPLARLVLSGIGAVRLRATYAVRLAQH
jgi:hypothetical protein